jgi:hypothetical protein
MCGCRIPVPPPIPIDEPVKGFSYGKVKIAPLGKSCCSTTLIEIISSRRAAAVRRHHDHGGDTPKGRERERSIISSSVMTSYRNCLSFSRLLAALTEQGSGTLVLECFRSHFQYSAV